MKSNQALREIMREQMEEKLEALKKKEEEKKKELEIDEERYSADLYRLELHTEPVPINWLERRNRFCIEKIVCSLLVPEHKTKTMRYIDHYRFRDEVVTQKNLFDLVKTPYIIFVLDYMYTMDYMIGWVDDDLYKILHFSSTRCPSGYCNSDSVHQIVGISAEDALNQFLFVKMRKEDRKDILELFRKLPKKE